MVTIGKHGLSAKSVKVGRGNETNIAMSTDGHKSRRFNIAMGGLDDASTTKAVGESFFD